MTEKSTTVPAKVASLPMIQTKEEFIAKSKAYEGFRSSLNENYAVIKAYANVADDEQAKKLAELLKGNKKAATVLKESRDKNMLPYKNASEQIKEAYKALEEILEITDKAGKQYLDTYNKAKEEAAAERKKQLDQETREAAEKANQEIVRIREIANKLSLTERLIMDKVDNATSVADMKVIHAEFFANKIDFEELNNQGIAMYKRMGELATAKMKEIKTGEKQDVDAIKEQVAIAAVEVTQAVIEAKVDAQNEVNSKELELAAINKEAAAIGTTTVRNITWKIHSTETEVARQFLSVDEKKVKHYIDAKRDELKKKLNAEEDAKILVGGIVISYEIKTRAK
jgi:hypothetical protein